MFRSVSNKEWDVGGAGDVIITDYILLERTGFTIRTKPVLSAVYFIDDDTGWTVGTDGFIARSIMVVKNGRSKKVRQARTSIASIALIASTAGQSEVKVP